MQLIDQVERAAIEAISYESDHGCQLFWIPCW